MKISGNEIRPNIIIEHKGRLWMVLKTDHVKPGKGGAYAQVEMKDIKDGTKLNERFRSADTVETVKLERREYQYLYAEGENLALMDPETFEQINVPARLAGDAGVYLADGMIVTVESFNDEPLSMRLPETVVLEIVEADPVLKGQTAASSYKPARLSNGVRILVPPHVDTGMRVVVRTTDSSYVERAKD